MQSMGRVRDVLNDHINEVMRGAFEGLETFEFAKEEYDYYYYLFQSTWEYKGIAYKHFLAREINNATEDWKQIFLKDLYMFYCPEEFSSPKPAIEDTGFVADYEAAPAPPSWFGDLHPVEEAPIRFRIGE